MGRAAVASVMLNRGVVFYLNSDMATGVINDCAAFPKGKNDDLVDTVTMAWIWLRKKFWLELPEDTQTTEEEEERKYTATKRRYYGS
jgi:phage terminase large subunit-like protein